MDFANPSEIAKNIFGGSLFSNDAFQVTIFIEVYFALHIGVIVFFFRFLICIFLQYLFLYHCTISTQWAKKNIKIIREILNDKSMRHQEVYSKCYLRGERQLLRLLFSEKQTRKITA